MVRTRGHFAKSQRLKGQAPFGHWKTQTFIAGLRRGALTAPFVVDQPMNRRIFDTWVRTQLVPTLSKGDVVILDNLAATKAPPPSKPSANAARGYSSCRLTAPSEPEFDGTLKAQGPPACPGRKNHR